VTTGDAWRHRQTILPDACRWIRHELSVRGGIAPTAVVIVSRSIPKTESGKLQRKRLGQLHMRGELAVEAELQFGRRP
jgi:acyl-coenzyme A synthetase/AMP-(fatty) acid ligase